MILLVLRCQCLIYNNTFETFYWSEIWKKPQMKINSLKKQKSWYLIHKKALQGSRCKLDIAIFTWRVHMQLRLQSLKESKNTINLTWGWHRPLYQSLPYSATQMSSCDMISPNRFITSIIVPKTFFSVSHAVCYSSSLLKFLTILLSNFHKSSVSGKKENPTRVIFFVSGKKETLLDE